MSATVTVSKWTERRAAAKPAHIPSGDQPACSTGEGLS